MGVDVFYLSSNRHVSDPSCKAHINKMSMQSFANCICYELHVHIEGAV